MKILFEEKAKEYIKNECDGIINIRSMRSMGAGGECCGEIKAIEVIKGVPEHEESYNLFEEDGIKIYIYNKLKLKANAEEDGIKIKMREIPFIKELIVEGIEILEF